MRRALAVSAPLMVALTALSRVYLGAHYLSDVLAGFAAGMVWLAANIIALEASLPKPAVT